MFGDLILYNKKKIDQYSTLITGKIKKEDANSFLEKEEKKSNYLLECSEFEKILQKRDDFYDYVDCNTDLTVKDIRMGSIIRVSGEIYIPEEFDMIQIIDEYKSFILQSIECKDNDERQLLSAVFHNSKMKIPIFCELDAKCDYWLGIGKVSQEDLLVDYNDLEEYEGKEVTIIAKAESRKFYKDSSLQVFDIYKDFLGLNRALRKEIAADKNNEFESIEVEEDYLGMELLAIY